MLRVGLLSLLLAAAPVSSLTPANRKLGNIYTNQSRFWQLVSKTDHHLKIVKVANIFIIALYILFIYRNLSSQRCEITAP